MQIEKHARFSLITTNVSSRHKHTGVGCLLRFHCLELSGPPPKTDHLSKDIKYKPKAASVRNTLGETI